MMHRVMSRKREEGTLVNMNQRREEGTLVRKICKFGGRGGRNNSDERGGLVGQFES